VKDDGENLGIEEEQILETMMVLFHIANSLGASLNFMNVRLGADEGCYSLQLRVSRPQPETLDPEILGFIRSRNFLKEARIGYRTA
jgi:GTPase